VCVVEREAFCDSVQRNYVYGIRVVPAVSGIQTAEDLISEMYAIHLSYMSVYTISKKLKASGHFG